MYLLCACPCFCIFYADFDKLCIVEIQVSLCQILVFDSRLKALYKKKLL